MSLSERTTAGPSGYQSTSHRLATSRCIRYSASDGSEQRAADQRLDRRHVADHEHRRARVSREQPIERGHDAAVDRGEALTAGRCRVGVGQPLPHLGRPLLPRLGELRPSHAPKSVSLQIVFDSQGRTRRAGGLLRGPPRPPQRRRDDRGDRRGIAAAGQPLRGGLGLPRAKLGQVDVPDSRETPSADSGVCPCRAARCWSAARCACCEPACRPPGGDAPSPAGRACPVRACPVRACPLRACPVRACPGPLGPLRPARPLTEAGSSGSRGSAAPCIRPGRSRRPRGCPVGRHPLASPRHAAAVQYRPSPHLPACPHGGCVPSVPTRTKPAAAHSRLRGRRVRAAAGPGA